MTDARNGLQRPRLAVGAAVAGVGTESNDAFAAARALSGTADSDSGSNTLASSEPGEPAHDGTAATRFAVVTWTALLPACSRSTRTAAVSTPCSRSIPAARSPRSRCRRATTTAATDRRAGWISSSQPARPIASRLTASRPPPAASCSPSPSTNARNRPSCSRRRAMCGWTRAAWRWKRSPVPVSR